MGNSTSSGRGHHEETVDFGYLTPQGVYTGPRDWNQPIVAQLIGERRLAPFYRPLEDYDESWDDEQILAHRKEPPQDSDAPAEASSSRADTGSISSSRSHKRGHASINSKEVIRHPEAAIYRGAVECPICFLYYPPNINHSRCCDQAICTECFVQIKRAEPNPTHLVSEPAACPYCVQENFGVVYAPPPWRTGLGSEGATPPSWPESPKQAESSPMAAMKRPRKSFGADSPEVVTIDQIRPDWEAKLAAVRAAVARRANRRIIMRQVGDRLIPVGISSGRVHALAPEEGQGENGEGAAEPGGGRSRRSRRRQQNQDINHLLGTMGLAGQDLEELMVMEAMRLSLLEHEEQQRKQREEEEKKRREQGGESAQSEGAGSSASPAPIDTSNAAAPSSAPTPEPAPSPTSALASSTPITPVGETPNAQGALALVPPPAPEPSASSPVSASSTTPDGTISAGSSQAADGNDSQPQTPPSAVEPSVSRSSSRPVRFDRVDSTASSLAPGAGGENYDVLSSSPESTVSHKPLLRSRPPSPPVLTPAAPDAA
ncbi:hypothetical protein DAEQUDRAFT_754109 [Daedalea quercina L-15889]|uniref:RING-type domain-containing protein n=1 Tax=Daedalea quercina L-15889 TaxID=1314783 RepID=A0A165TZ29_9APHY|nr:hypothetical protein DAEQUDRAFT_754109 [Daedalea quercina L-15889]